MQSRLRFILLVMLSFCLAGPATAESTNPVVLMPCQPHNEQQENADRELVSRLPPDPTASEAMVVLPQVETALAHAPDRPPFPEICGEQINIYDRALPTAAQQADAISAYVETHPDLAAKTFVRKQRMPYTFLAAYVSAVKGFRHNYYGALKAADKGIANDPDDPLMTDTKASILYTVQHYADALTLIDAYLIAHGKDPAFERSFHAALLIRKAQCLGKLNRHAESLATQAEANTYR